MWRRTASIITVAISLHSFSTVSADNTTTPSTLISRLDWVRLDVIRGRITARQVVPGSKPSQSASQRRGEVEEFLAYNACSEAISVSYRWEDAQQSIRLEVSDSDQVILECQPKGDYANRYLRFEQTNSQLLLHIGDPAESPVELAADNLWQLMLIEPQVCQVHLVPVLHKLRPDWALEQQCQRIKQHLMANLDPELPDAEQLSRLVSQLSSPQFRQRQQAAKQLRSYGQAVLPMLASLPEKQMDREQRLRLQQIKQSLEVDQVDLAARVAGWLAQDPHVWIALLHDANPDHRHFAAEQLERRCDRRFEFDAHADPVTRQQQIASLRLQLKK